MNITWIVLDDLKTNLIAALFVLILAASFTKIVELPITLTESRKQTEDGMKDVMRTNLIVFKKGNSLRVRVKDKDVAIKDVEELLGEIDPNAGVTMIVERGSGLPYDTLILMLETLKAKGVRFVSFLLQNR